MSENSSENSSDDDMFQSVQKEKQYKQKIHNMISSLS
jgi:hypothetical protein